MAQRTPVDRFGLLGTTLDRKFRVERLIAEGGFGVVYKATHVMLERPIALKVLKTPEELNDAAKAAFIDGFSREAKASVKINHPNIVQVLDFGVAEMPNGEMAPYMALEWLEGRTLRDELRARRGQGGRSPAAALALLRPALEALAYAHDEGIAHRDIKPANMMLVPTRRGETIKLLDFGIAKLMEEGEEAGSGETKTRSLLNAFSLQYAAPEQIGGSRTGPWTDVHAMGLILTEVLTDQPPYDGKERTEICCEVLSPTRPTPAKRKIDVGPWEQVLAKALALRPADRYANAGELLAALEETLPAISTGRFSPPGGTSVSASTAAGSEADHVSLVTGPSGVGSEASAPSLVTGPSVVVSVPSVPVVPSMAEPVPVPVETGEHASPTTLRGTVTTHSSVSSATVRRVRPGVLVGIGVFLLVVGGIVAVRITRGGSSDHRAAATVPAQSTTVSGGLVARPPAPQMQIPVSPPASPVTPSGTSMNMNGGSAATSQRNDSSTVPATSGRSTNRSVTGLRSGRVTNTSASVRASERVVRDTSRAVPGRRDSAHGGQPTRITSSTRVEVE